MGLAFHQILSQLRKRKRVSQRKVAADLYISQALLSHYENGIREPGLDFVNRACNYYGVSADYLLGRTEAELAEALSAPNGEAPQAEFDARALITLLQSINSLENEALFTAALRCFGAAAYRLLRHMAALDPESTALFLTVPENRVALSAGFEQSSAEAAFLDGLEGLSADSEEQKRLILPQLEALLLSLDKQVALHTQPKEQS